MSEILKICAMGVAGVITVSLVRSYKPEFTAGALLCVSLIMLYYVLESLKIGFSFASLLLDRVSGGREYFPVILKVLAIAYVTEFTSSLCEDAGERSIASKVELAGKISIFFAAIPIFSSLLNLIEGVMQV